MILSDENIENVDNQSSILVVEDDADINHLLKKILERQNMKVTQAFSGTEAQLRLSMGTFQLALLDLMLPGVTGETLIPEFTQRNIPVIVISAKAGLENRVQVLNLGADDYIEKPFEADEVVARVNALLRRLKRMEKPEKMQSEISEELTNSISNCNDVTVKQVVPAGQGDHVLTQESFDQVLKYRQIVLNEKSRVVLVNGTEISLTGHEFDILHVLLSNPDRVFSRQALYEEVWQGGYYGEDNTVNVHISNLRKKIAEVAGDTEYIKTVWGIGFKLV